MSGSSFTYIYLLFLTLYAKKFDRKIKKIRFRFLVFAYESTCRLKSGKLVSVTRRIPSSSPFRRYEELCQYWSQVYGYALPEDCSEMVYFNVEMTRNGAVFTYPSCCVYSQLPKEMDAEVDPEPILRQLWKSLSNVMKLYEERLVLILQSLPQPLSIQGKLSKIL